MKKRIPILFASLSFTFIFGLSLMAQEKTEIAVQVKKDGKVVKDTTYQFEDAGEAKHAMKMMEVLSGGEKQMEHHNYSMAHSGEGHSKTMVFISEDGEKTVIKEVHGDSLVWIDEGEGHDCVKKKEIKVIVSGDEKGSRTVDSNELIEIDEDENVYVIKNKDGDVDLEKIMEEHEGEDVKVIVIKKEKK
ncbi:MAG: hypothetical protein ABFS28_07850 [Bacteroidota bacterium]